MTDFIFDGPANASVTVLLAHGAGAPMDSAAMTAAAKALTAEGLRVARFEFGYMASRRTGERRPPPKAETVMSEYVEAIDALMSKGRLIIGGKSMGGRVASMIADEMHAADRIAGLVCLGYPFHPPGKPEQLRTAHLKDLACPTLIVQGERDPFGSRAEVESLVEAGALAPAIRFHWAGDGDHDLGPRGGSGFTRKANLAAAADAVAAWCQTL
jgi:predicted alpha/beta-hydrolase family hydrolase